MSMAKLKVRFRLQAYLGAMIIDYGNQAFLVLCLIDDRKEGGLYHEYTSKRISS